MEKSGAKPDCEISGGGTYAYGTSVAVTATVVIAKFVGWYDADVRVSKDKSYTFTVTKDWSLTARFQ